MKPQSMRSDKLPVWPTWCQTVEYLLQVMGTLEEKSWTRGGYVLRVEKCTQQMDSRQMFWYEKYQQ